MKLAGTPQSAVRRWVAEAGSGTRFSAGLRLLPHSLAALHRSAGGKPATASVCQIGALAAGAQRRVQSRIAAIMRWPYRRDLAALGSLTR